MRRHISKSIVRRSTALRASLDKYNELAPLQDPPRPAIDYADITNCAWLGDFDLLRHSRHEILSKPWATRSNREVANKWFKVAGARFEILRLNVEIRRLSAWVDAEDRQLSEVASSLLSTQPLLSAEVLELARKRRRLNNVHRNRLQAIYRLKGFTGIVPETATTCNSGGRDLDSDEDLDDQEVQPYDDDSLDQEASALEDTMLRLHVE